MEIALRRSMARAPSLVRLIPVNSDRFFSRGLLLEPLILLFLPICRISPTTRPTFPLRIPRPFSFAKSPASWLPSG